MIHEFHLSPPGSGRGPSCDANGAFVGDIPLLKRSIIDGREKWEARECRELSENIGANFGLPIDMSSKMGGVRAIANALNEGDVARAQVATVLLAIPDPPVLAKGACSPADLVDFIRQLQWSGLIKADWEPDEHPRWPAGAPDSQGGQFAPKGDDTGQAISDAAALRASRDMPPEIGISPRQRFFAAPMFHRTFSPHCGPTSKASIHCSAAAGSHRQMTPRTSASMQATAITSAMCRWPAPMRPPWTA
ncbi:MAG: hypothetical protein ABSD74_19990 [Rhizomicrobium sp.]|jgi:hypothetical protein